MCKNAGVVLTKYALPWSQWQKDRNTWYRLCNQGKLVACIRYREFNSDYLIFSFQNLKNVIRSDDCLVSSTLEDAMRHCDNKLAKLNYKLLDDRTMNFA